MSTHSWSPYYIRTNPRCSTSADLARSGSDIQHDDLDIYPLAEIAGYDLFDDDHPDHFFPVHSACDQIAIEFFAFANEGENVLGTSRGLHTLVRSEADLYLAFERQFETDVHRRTFPTEKFRLEWDNKSHGAAAYQNVVLDNSPGNAQTGELEQPTLFNQGWIRVEESEVSLLSTQQSFLCLPHSSHRLQTSCSC